MCYRCLPFRLATPPGFHVARIPKGNLVDHIDHIDHTDHIDHIDHRDHIDNIDNIDHIDCIDHMDPVSVVMVRGAGSAWYMSNPRNMYYKYFVVDHSDQIRLLLVDMIDRPCR